MPTLANELRSELFSCPRPILKWAGGKSQLIPALTHYLPKAYGKYIEPFFGGGALFFHLCPEKSIIADANPELTNLYTQVADNVENVITHLKKYKNESELFYEVRAKDWRKLAPVEAAARTLFLNKTCFNGLYRVNKKGQFNTPFGYYKNPNLCDEDTIRSASIALQKTQIILGDYKTVLQNHAKEGDFIFLDPPYLPIGRYSDFKRYTAEQFYEEDHRILSEEIERLHKLGCHVILTNSNHPLVHELYGRFDLNIVSSKRYINSKAVGRTGEDVIINIPPVHKISLRLVPALLPEQVNKFPSTRYMGAKTKLLTQIWDIASQFKFESAIDLFSGSGVVSYMFKSQGKEVFANDYMAMATTYAKATVENSSVTLDASKANRLIEPTKDNDGFVQKTFNGLYYTKEDNLLIDNIRANIKKLRSPYEKAIAMSALMRACIKKRPRGIFTYVGYRYDDGRADLQKSLADHFLDAVKTINTSIFNNGKENKARNGDALTLACRADLVYLDPPYYSPLSDNEYVRRYHFLEGLARDWQGVEIQEHTLTKKFKSFPTPFASRKGAANAFDKLFSKYKNQLLIVSYSSNSLPTLDEMIEILSKYKSQVEVVSVDYKYSFGNQGHKVGDNNNSAKEYLFVGY